MVELDTHGIQGAQLGCTNYQIRPVTVTTKFICPPLQKDISISVSVSGPTAIKQVRAGHQHSYVPHHSHTTAEQILVFTLTKA